MIKKVLHDLLRSGAGYEEDERHGAGLRALAWGAVALALMLAWWLWGRSGFFEAHLAPRHWEAAAVDYWAAMYQFASAFVLWFAVPLLLRRPLGLGDVRELGLGAGDVKLGVVLALAGVILVAIPGGFVAAGMSDMRVTYPLARSAFDTPSRAVAYELAYGLLYYVAWESFYRGFLQLGLARRLGNVSAILLQVTATTLMHLDKPAGEIWTAFFAGFIFGFLVLRLRSVWPLFLIHWALGVFTDVFCAWRAGLGVFG
ncbi:MAG: CPBP family intramembrane metalloprotease [Deltaproteobacteria bacterium]|nr:MAG: CPBP family intramembrane metalloprotease [Deltaproteobacteria bacterium]